MTPLAQKGKVTLERIPAQASSSYHIFYLRTRTPAEQETLLLHLKSCGIPAAFHYVPLHTSLFGSSLHPNPVSLPVTEMAAATLVRLPIGTHLSDEQAAYVADAVLGFYETNDERQTTRDE